MYYAYDICPKCLNNLFKRKQIKDKNEFEKYSGDICPKCGEKLVLACVGDKEDDNTIYKITLNNIISKIALKGMDSNKNVEKCIETIMKISNCDANLAKEKLNSNNSFLCEGDFVKTYISMEMLDNFEIGYTVTPQFPFSRYIYANMFYCPQCGSEMIEKEEDAVDLKNHIMRGWFCNNCNDWIAYCYVDKLDIDDTIYKLTFSLGKNDSTEKEKLLKLIDKLTDKQIINNTIIINDKASAIYEILQRLESINISYVIEPIFPHEILKFRRYEK